MFIEEEYELGGEVVMGLEDDALPTDGEQLVQFFYWKLLRDQRAAELYIVE